MNASSKHCGRLLEASLGISEATMENFRAWRGTDHCVNISTSCETRRVIFRLESNVLKDRQDFYDYEWRKSAATCKLSKAIKFFHFTSFLLLPFILDIVLVNFLSQFLYFFRVLFQLSLLLVFMLAFAFCCKSEKRIKNIFAVHFSIRFMQFYFVVCCVLLIFFVVQFRWEKPEEHIERFFFLSSLKNYPDREENVQRGLKKKYVKSVPKSPLDS